MATDFGREYLVSLCSDSMIVPSVTLSVTLVVTLN